MSRIDREPRLHIHDAMVQELNEMSILVKVHHIIKRTDDLAVKIKSNHPHVPTWKEIAELLDRAVSEMNQCTKSYIKK